MSMSVCCGGVQDVSEAAHLIVQLTSFLAQKLIGIIAHVLGYGFFEILVLFPTIGYVACHQALRDLSTLVLQSW